MWSTISICSVVIFCHLIPSSLSLPQSSGLPMPSPIESMLCQRNEQCSAKYPDSDCRDGRYCKCSKGFVTDFDKCRPISLDLISECEINAQCAMGLGNLSRCNDQTKRCECYDTVGHGKNSTAYAPHYCYYRKELGSRCDLNEECKASITPAESVSCDVLRRVCVCEAGKTCENVAGSGNSFGKNLALVLVAFVAVKIAL